MEDDGKIGESMMMNGQKNNAAKWPHRLGCDRQAEDKEDEGEGATLLSGS